MNDDQIDKNEFKKLLEESDIDIKQILKEKDGKTNDSQSKHYVSVNVSHYDLYNENLNIEFSHKKHRVAWA